MAALMLVADLQYIDIWHRGNVFMLEQFKGGEGGGGASGDHIRLVSASLMHSITVTCLLTTSATSWGPTSQCGTLLEHFKVSVRKLNWIIAGHVSVHIRSFSEWRYFHCKTCKLSLTLLYRHDDPHTLTLSPCSIPPFQLFMAHPLKQS